MRNKVENKEWEQTVLSGDNIATAGYGEYDKEKNMVIRGMQIQSVLEIQAQVAFAAGAASRGIEVSALKELCADMVKAQAKLIEQAKQEDTRPF
jgi:hypothetical protein